VNPVAIPTLPSGTSAPAAIPGEWIFRLSLSQYHEMIRTDILGEDDPVELLEGVLTYKMPKNNRHCVVTHRLVRALEGLIGNRFLIRPQEPITLSDSEPEPDVAVVRGNPPETAGRHPVASEVAIVVEVADASLARDRLIKKRLYAREGIPIYWIVNLSDQRIEVFSEPSGASTAPDYARAKVFEISDQVPVVLDGVELGQITAAGILS
jgi:Uma2 family endonuclease